MKQLVISCVLCGSKYGMSIIKRLESATDNADSVCPICRGRRSALYNAETAECLTEINLAFCFNADFNVPVEAIYIDDNGIGNPRLVIRFADNYFINRKTPHGFIIEQTRPDSPCPCPVEMVKSFDVTLRKHKVEFLKELRDVVRYVQDWLDDINSFKKDN
jgi:DNA-binding XRE family transcriptional regulator